jgi:hypothetical protein
MAMRAETITLWFLRVVAAIYHKSRDFNCLAILRKTL